MAQKSLFTTPRVIREDARGHYMTDIRDEMLKDRKIQLIGEIDEDSVNSLVLQLQFLDQESHDPIDIYINSPGGSVSDGLAIYDMMQAIKSDVRTVCLGTAASMGAVIFASGDERAMLPHARVMIHDPLIERTGGSAMKLKMVSDNLMRTREIIAGILARHTGKSMDEILEITANDSYFYAEEAINFGFADKIIHEL